jgi:hypothetical protein
VDLAVLRVAVDRMLAFSKWLPRVHEGASFLFIESGIEQMQIKL